MPTVALRASPCFVRRNSGKNTRNLHTSRVPNAIHGRSRATPLSSSRRTLQVSAGGVLSGFSRDMYLSLDEGVVNQHGKSVSDEGIGENVFMGAVAEPYLKKQVNASS